LPLGVTARNVTDKQGTLERRVFTPSDGDLQAAVGAPNVIAQVCVCRGPLTLIAILLAQPGVLRPQLLRRPRQLPVRRQQLIFLLGSHRGQAKPR